LGAQLTARSGHQAEDRQHEKQRREERQQKVVGKLRRVPKDIVLAGLRERSFGQRERRESAKLPQ
jgi:hypothetical protein